MSHKIAHAPIPFPEWGRFAWGLEDVLVLSAGM